MSLKLLCLHLIFEMFCQSGIRADVSSVCNAVILFEGLLILTFIMIYCKGGVVNLSLDVLLQFYLYVHLIFHTFSDSVQRDRHMIIAEAFLSF